MREINYTSKFKKDLKRERKGQHKATVDAELETLVELIAADSVLPQAYGDHSLSGEWRDHRDAHVRPDLVLIYRKVGDTNLELV
jgi:mRNA interferase YafQ